MNDCRECERCLMAWVAGELEPAAAEAYQRHLDASASCRQQARQLRAVFESARALPDPEPAPAIVHALQQQARAQLGARPVTGSWLARLRSLIGKRAFLPLWAPALVAAGLMVVLLHPHLTRRASEGMTEPTQQLTTRSLDAVSQDKQVPKWEQKDGTAPRSDDELEQSLGDAAEREQAEPATRARKPELDARDRAGSTPAAAAAQKKKQDRNLLQPSGRVQQAPQAPPPAAPTEEQAARLAHPAPADDRADAGEALRNENRRQVGTKSIRVETAERRRHERSEQPADLDAMQAKPAKGARDSLAAAGFAGRPVAESRGSEQELFQLARAKEESGELGEAVEILERLAAEGSAVKTRARALMRLASLHQKRHDLEAARKALREALQLDPELEARVESRLRQLQAADK
jgi:hypothetical protein